MHLMQCSGSRQDFRFLSGMPESLDDFRYGKTRHLLFGSIRKERSKRSALHDSSACLRSTGVAAIGLGTLRVCQHKAFSPANDLSFAFGTKLGRGRSCFAFEDSGHVFGVLKTGTLGDFMDGQLGFA